MTVTIDPPPLSDQDRQRILIDWNQTDEAVPPAFFHEVIAEIAGRTPDAVAVTWPGGRLTFGELDDRANRLARRLLALGVSPHFVHTALRVPAKAAIAAPSHPLPARSPRVVMVVLDAFRADYQALAPMPNLNWLMERGVSYRNAWVGQLESMTPASHATISTGATPAHHGVIGFSWRDGATGQEVYGAWYDGVMAGRLEQQLRQHHVYSIPKRREACRSLGSCGGAQQREILRR